MTYLLDTNICIHLFKGHENLERKIESVGINACYLCEITIAELLYGVENSALSRRADNRKNLEWLRTAFAGRIVRISLCFDEYARQKVALKRIGRPVGEFDLLIGSKNHILVTRNTRDFDNLGKNRVFDMFINHIRQRRGSSAFAIHSRTPASYPKFCEGGSLFLF